MGAVLAEARRCRSAATPAKADLLPYAIRVAAQLADTPAPHEERKRLRCVSRIPCSRAVESCPQCPHRTFSVVRSWRTLRPRNSRFAGEYEPLRTGAHARIGRHAGGHWFEPTTPHLMKDRWRGFSLPGRAAMARGSLTSASYAAKPGRGELARPSRHRRFPTAQGRGRNGTRTPAPTRYPGGMSYRSPGTSRRPSRSAR